MKNDSLSILNTIAQTIYDKKGMNILALDVHRFSSLTDYAIIAEGTVDRHVIAIAKAVIDSLQKMGESPLYVEGIKVGDWIVLDYVKIMVHIFMPGLREKYHLEELWQKGDIVDLTINVSPSESKVYFRNQA